MIIKLTGNGLLDPRQLRAWRAEKKKKIREAVRAGMAAGGAKAAREVQGAVQSKLKTKTRGFVKSWKHKVYSAKADRLPALWVGSKVPWSGVHEYGATISGKMLIPINLTRRMGRKRFAEVVRNLMRSGNAFFKKTKRGQVVLFAENIKDNAFDLRKFKSGLRARKRAQGKRARISRGVEVPIAVLVPRVTVPARVGMRAIVRRHVPAIAREIQSRLR